MYLLLAQAGFALLLLRLIWQPIYNLFFHPARHFPGPLLWRASRFPWIYHARNGTLHKKMHEFHERYGTAVRTAPSELSFIDEAAWKDIYGHRIGVHGGQDENEKWRVAYAGSLKAPRGLLSAPRAEHTFLRRLLSHGFSDRSLRAQEATIRKYADTLIHRLRAESNDGKNEVDIKLWYGCTTFDIIGDLGFAADFNSLKSEENRHWSLMFGRPESLKAPMFGTTRRMILWDWLCDYINKKMPGSVQNGEFQKYAFETLNARAAYTVERPDLIEGLVRNMEKEKIPKETVMRTAGLLLGAGFETTASLLTAVTFLLATHPEYLEKVSHEVRSTFKSAEDITLASVDKLEYMIACLSEALRWYPPVAMGMQRLAMKGGTTVAGHAVPEQTVMAVPHWAAYRSSMHFTKAHEYHPERWLGDKEFASDHLDVVQPFQVGPRNCIGRNLALAEMRIVLALVLYNFDIRLAPGMENWATDQEFYVLWKRDALNVHLTPVLG